MSNNPATHTPTRTAGWFARLTRSFKSAVSVDETNPGISLRVAGVNHRELCLWIGKLHDVVFTRKPRFFWAGGGLCAEFGFGEKMFQIEADPWDDALWVGCKDKLTHPEELTAIRLHLEALASPHAPQRGAFNLCVK